MATNISSARRATATTTVVAWIGAVSGISGLLWNFYKWKINKPKLYVSVKTGMVIKGVIPSA
jgi:hypothetical protein